MPFSATCMDLEVIILSEVSQKEKDKYMISLTCGVHKMIQMNLFMNQKQTETHRHGEQTCPCQEVGVEGGMYWDFGNSRCKLLYIRWINKKVPLYNIGSYIQYPVVKHIHTFHIYESLCCTLEINTL